MNVLLIDTLNTDKQDQTYVHSQIINFLKKMQPGMRVAVFVLGRSCAWCRDSQPTACAAEDAVNDKKDGISTESETSVTRSLQDKLDDIEEKQRMAGRCR